MQAETEIRHIETDVELAASFPVMQELRPHLTDSAAYVEQIKRQHVQGYRLLAAWRNDSIVGLAGYREVESTIYGRFVYVDDLVVTGQLQRSGIGELLLQSARQQAARLDCKILYWIPACICRWHNAFTSARGYWLAACTLSKRFNRDDMNRILLLNCGPHSEASHGYRLARETLAAAASRMHT